MCHCCTCTHSFYYYYTHIHRCTFAFVLLSEYPMHELTTHLTEGGANKSVRLVRHIYIKMAGKYINFRA